MPRFRMRLINYRIIDDPDQMFTFMFGRMDDSLPMIMVDVKGLFERSLDLGQANCDGNFLWFVDLE